MYKNSVDFVFVNLTVLALTVNKLLSRTMSSFNFSIYYNVPAMKHVSQMDTTCM